MYTKYIPRSDSRDVIRKEAGNALTRGISSFRLSIRKVDKSSGIHI